jgi:site-specific DNA-cytosine methylase
LVYTKEYPIENVQKHYKYSRTDRCNELAKIGKRNGRPRTSEKIYSEKGKISALLSNHNGGSKTKIYNGGHVRYLTQTELERLQTVPEGYTSCVSRNQAANLLGDGWTIDVIEHIFQYLKQ